MVIAALALLALPSAGVARDRSSPAKPVVSPANWFPSDSYPAEAKRNSQQGRVSIQLTIDKAGTPSACKVMTSSGAASLDAVTCKLAMANGKFVPARDAAGQPIETTYVIPGVRWALMDTRPTKLEGAWRVAAVVEIDRAGRLTSCRDERKGPAPEELRLCSAMALMPPAFGLFVRHYSTDAAPVEMVAESTLTFDGGTALPTLYDSGGRETLMMSEVHFDVDTDGKTQNCRVIAQSGPDPTSPCDHPPGPFFPLAKPQGATLVAATSRAGAR
jgi:TonB family protein